MNRQPPPFVSRPGSAASDFRLLTSALLLAAFCLLAFWSPAAAAGGPYEGTWTGSGTDAGGKVVSLTLTVSGAGVTGVSYNFPGSNGLSCNDPLRAPFPGGAAVPINNDSFAYSDTGLTITGTFSS